MTNSKIYIFIIVVILVCAGIIGLVYYFFAKDDNLPEVNTGYPQSILSVINNPLERISDNFSNIVKDEQFLISYGGDSNQGTFYITVNAEPIVEVSKRAEQAFINKLQIDESYACQIDVILNVPSIIDDELAAYDFGLSFCPDKPHIEDVPQNPDQTNQYIDEAPAEPQEESFNIR
jgi:hypothetical protein